MTATCSVIGDDDIPLRHRPAGERPPSYDKVSAILVDRAGRLWIASTEQGLGRVDQPHADIPTITWYGRAQGLSSNTAGAIVEDVSGILFVGTGRGVDRFDPNTGRFTHYTVSAGGIDVSDPDGSGMNVYNQNGVVVGRFGQGRAPLGNQPLRNLLLFSDQNGRQRIRWR